MSILSHIQHLQAKHAELEAILAQEMNHPAPDFFRVKETKKQKLLVKEEITRLLQESDATESQQDAS